MKYSLDKKDISILVGNSLDHFDTSLYSFLTPVTAPLFFPNHTPIMQLILSYSVLATSLITRPLGSFIFGMLARIYNPVKGLSYSLIGIAVSTMIIGLLPSYNQIGIFAPILLILTRMVGGTFAAGEVTISKLYILEGKTGTHAIKVSYLYESSTMVGVVLASFSSWLAISNSWTHGWRVCFILGGLTGIAGYFLRKYSIDSKNPTINLNKFKSYNLSVFKNLWVNKIILLRIAIMTSFGYVTYSIPFIVMNSFIPLVSSIPTAVMAEFNTKLLIVDMLLIPIIGRFTEKFKPRNILLFSSLVLAVTIVPLWSFIPGSSLIYVTFVRLWIIIFGIIFLCPLNAWYKSIFLTADQYLIVGLGNALGACTLGHLTPAICLSIRYFTHNNLYLAYYIATIAILSFLVVKTTKG